MHKSVVTKAFLYMTILSTLITAFISHAILLPLSAQNYPGGHALQALHRYYGNNYNLVLPLHNTDPSHPQIHVHLTNLALQSGITRFLEQPLPLYDFGATTQCTADDYPSVQGFHNNQGDTSQKHPIVLPGDANHPALTINPNPNPSSNPSSQQQRQNLNPRPFPSPAWIYDKSPTPSHAQNSTFFDTFDFLIVESPSTLPLSGRWVPIARIKSLGRPQVLRRPIDGHRIAPRYDPWFVTTRSELLHWWTHFEGGEYNDVFDNISEDDETSIASGRSGTRELIMRMYPEWVAAPLVRAVDWLHDALRLDWEVRGTWWDVLRREGGWTGGWWIEVPVVTRLWVLRNCEGGGLGCEGGETFGSAVRESEVIGGDSGSGGSGDGGERGVEEGNEETQYLLDMSGVNGDGASGQLEQDWDALGPLVVNKDGTLSRLDNWRDMNVQERKRTVEYLRKRNLIRLEEMEG